jgi:S1-C subfamily serine protease
MTAWELKRVPEAVSYWERALRTDAGYFDTRPAERQRWERSVATVGPQLPAPIEGAAPTAPTAPAASTAPAATSGSAENEVGVTSPAPRVSLRRSTASSSGSGFVVTGDGLVLTNKHVIRGCTSIKVRADGAEPVAASIRALDGDDDLALLKAPLPGATIAAFREDPPVRPGDDVVAVGYPLSGLLADQVNVSTGTVNALAGLYNDLHLLQMSAPVQPGSSGGPLFDVSGNVVGVVVTKLNAKIVAEETGDIPQNVNFAIKAAVAREFLEKSGVQYRTARSVAPRSHADVGDVGRKVTVLVECWK